MNKIMLNKERHILLILTWRCQNACPYCWEVLMGREKRLPPYDDPSERGWYEWLDLFNELPPCFIDLSGGEPLIYKGFHRLLELMPSRHALALSTNLVDGPGFHQLLNTSPDRFTSITCSYHKFGVLKGRRFIERVKTLKEAGHPVHVNIVNHPEYDFHRGEDKEVLMDLRAVGVKVNISPFENPEFLEKTGKRLTCNAGLNTFTVVPNGDVYRCLSWFRSRHREEGYQGNLFNGFKLFEKRMPCYLNCEIYNILNAEHSQPNMFSTYVKAEPL